SKDFPKNCVCMPTNHDMSPLRQWWKEDPEKTEMYYHAILQKEGAPPKHLSAQLAKEIVQAHLSSKADFAIFLFQDLLAIEEGMRMPLSLSERINDPAKQNHQWRWRMHLAVCIIASALSCKTRKNASYRL
nr:4-alpha-glucanotransferase [Gammaproteobacteria bacterium]